MTSVGELGLLPAALQELATFQHVHNCSTGTASVPVTAKDDGSGTGSDAAVTGVTDVLVCGSRYIAQPQGVMRLSPELLANGSFGWSDILSLGNTADDSSARRDSSNSISKKRGAVSEDVVTFPVLCLTFAPIRTTLAAILEANSNIDKLQNIKSSSATTAQSLAGVNNGHLITPTLALELFRDLLCAINHLIHW